MTDENHRIDSYRPCVGVVLCNAQGQVFLGQRIDRMEPAWQMPQGGIDSGETAEVAALRELEEETGISAVLVSNTTQTADWVYYDFPSDVQKTRWKGRFLGQRQKWFLFRFLGRDLDINIATKHPEFSAWQWASREKAVAEIVPFKRETYQQVLTEFAPYLDGLSKAAPSE